MQPIIPKKIFEFDFSDKRWFVQAENTAPVKIGTLNWSEQFRLIYRPPPPIKPPASIWKTAAASGMDICPPEHFMAGVELTDALND